MLPYHRITKKLIIGELNEFCYRKYKSTSKSNYMTALAACMQADNRDILEDTITIRLS